MNAYAKDKARAERRYAEKKMRGECVFAYFFNLRVWLCRTHDCEVARQPNSHSGMPQYKCSRTP